MGVGIIFHGENKADSYFNDVVPWETSLKSFGIDEITVVDTTDDNQFAGYGNNPDNKWSEKDLKKAVKRYKKYKTVMVSPHGTINLKDFQHPEDAVYIFGQDDGSPDLENPDFYVKVPVSNDLWAFGAMHIILWDRISKSWQ